MIQGPGTPATSHKYHDRLLDTLIRVECATSKQLHDLDLGHVVAASSVLDDTQARTALTFAQSYKYHSVFIRSLLGLTDPGKPEIEPLLIFSATFVQYANWARFGA